MEHLHSFDRICWPVSRSFHRTVSFSELVRVDHIPSKNELSKKQRKALWYPEPTKSRGLLKQVMCGSAPVHSDDGDEVRAMEDRSGRSLPVSAVLAEQESQREGCAPPDPKQIAKVYHRCSSYSTIRAQMRALEVHHDATEYLRQPSKHGRQRIVLLEKER